MRGWGLGTRQGGGGGVEEVEGGGVEEVVYLLMIHLCMCRQWRRTRKTRGTLKLKN